MTISHGDLLSRLVELFDYRVKEVSYVDEGANLIPFLLTKNLKRANVEKEAFEALLRTEIKNADKVIEVMKKAGIEDKDQVAFQNVLKVLTHLKKNKALSKKTLGDALAVAELADMTGDTDANVDVKKALEFVAEKLAVKVVKMFGDEKIPPKDAEPMLEDEEEKKKKAEYDAAKACMTEEEKKKEQEMSSEEAENINKRRNGMDISNLPVNQDGTLDVVALKKAKLDDNTITVLKGLYDQNASLTKTLDAVNAKLNSEVELRVDKHYSLEAGQFGNIKFEGLKEVLKKFGTSCPEEYPKLKSLLTVCNDTLKPASQRDFTPMGGSVGASSSEPSTFYNVMKAKAVEMFKGDSPVVALNKYWKQTEEGRRDYLQYDSMVTNK